MKIFRPLINYFSQSFEELKKVSWPNKNEIIKLSAIVIVSIVISMLVLAGIDWGLSKIVNMIIGG